MAAATTSTDTQRPLYVRRSIVRAEDRFSMTLFVAAVIHIIVILGIGFQLPEPDRNPPDLPTLEITLVHHRSDETPEKADFLAQASQMGGGDAKTKTRPQSPASAPSVIPKPGAAQAAAPSSPATPVERLAPPALVRDVASANLAIEREPTPQTPPTPVTAVQLIEQSMEMASLSTEISREYEFDAQRPRQKYISAQTRESKYAAYMEAWRAKVERVGNINYPASAKAQNLTGSLILDVAVNPDGTIRDIKMLRSSGHAVLDRAAIQIVRLAAPFSPFPPAIREETDLLHVIRTWQFLTGNRLSARG